MSKQTDAFPVPPRTKRTTLTLPAETVERIEHIARRLGVSQSAFVSELLSEPIAAMALIFDELPQADASEGDVLRARGRSVALIRDAVQQAQALLREAEDHLQTPAASAPPARPAKPRRRR